MLGISLSFSLCIFSVTHELWFCQLFLGTRLRSLRLWLLVIHFFILIFSCMNCVLSCLSLREVFQCSVLICFWRVRHAWHKNLIKKCSEMETCAAIAKWLGQAVHHICKGDGTAVLFEEFMEDFVDAADFMDYFKATWYPRLG